MHRYLRILSRVYILFCLGLTLNCDAKSRKISDKDSSHNAINLIPSSPPTVQFGVNFGDVTAFNKAQLQTAIDIVNQHKIQFIRVYDQFHTTQNWNDFMDLIQQNSKPPNNFPIKIAVGVMNNDLENSFNTSENATKFITTYILKYQDNIQTILLGNELSTKHENLISRISTYAANLKIALNAAQIRNIDIGLSIGGHVSPTSSGDLTGWCDVNQKLINAINDSNRTTLKITQLFLNDYPYFSPNTLKNIEIYDNFKGCFGSFQDSINKNVPTHNQIKLAIGETGWPSKGTATGAQTPSVTKTNANLNCIMSGVYKNPPSGTPLTYVFFFELFDENKSSDKNDPENYFGLFENFVDKNNEPKDKKYNPKTDVTLNFKDPSQAQCPQ